MLALGEVIVEEDAPPVRHVIAPVPGSLPGPRAALCPWTHGASCASAESSQRWAAPEAGKHQTSRLHRKACVRSDPHHMCKL